MTRVLLFALYLFSTGFSSACKVLPCGPEGLRQSERPSPMVPSSGWGSRAINPLQIFIFIFISTPGNVRNNRHEPQLVWDGVMHPVQGGLASWKPFSTRATGCFTSSPLASLLHAVQHMEHKTLREKPSGNDFHGQINSALCFPSGHQEEPNCQEQGWWAASAGRGFEVTSRVCGSFPKGSFKNHSCGSFHRFCLKR